MNNEQEWFNSFVQSIPCPNCQHHFESFIKENPPNFESRPKFFSWTVDAHNYVNRATGKKETTKLQAMIEHLEAILQ